MAEAIEKLVLDRSKGKNQPLYQQVSKKIRGLIESETLQDGHGLPSVATLSRMLGISYRTAKMAYDLLEEGNFVKYVPNKGAVVNQRKAVGAKASFSITYIRPRINSVWGAISRGVEKFCLENNIGFSLCEANSSHELYLNALQNPVGEYEGLLIAPYELPQYNEILTKMVDDGVKMVFVDRVLPGINVSSVSADHFLGVYEVVSHLLSEHDFPVYYFGQYESPSSSRSWFDGWKGAMYEYNYHEVEKYVYGLSAGEAELFTHKWYAVEDITKAALRFLNTISSFPCSVFASGDHIAKGIYIAAKEIGMEIGRDIFLAGYGNIPMCEKVDVPLTSVDQNSEQVGYCSAELLYRHLKGELCLPVHLVCPTRVHIRRSSTGHHGIK